MDASGVPFHSTVAPDRKFVPVTINANPGPPGRAEPGLRLVIVGGPLLCSTMLNVSPFETGWFGFRTVMIAVPADCTKLEGTEASS